MLYILRGSRVDLQASMQTARTCVLQRQLGLLSFFHPTPPDFHHLIITAQWVSK